MEEYRNALIVKNNVDEEEMKKLISESSLYQEAYEKSVNYKLFQKNKITNSFKDFIIYLLLKKRIEKELSENVLGYALTINEIQNKIENRNVEIEKINSSVELLNNEQFVKKLKIRNNLKK